MNKKMKTIKFLCKGCFMSLAILAMASCADGFDSNESFTSDVKNSQLESPKLTAESFSSKVNSDGTESVNVKWDVVYGAGGYACTAKIVDDPTNPVLVCDTIIDGTSFLFDKKEDTKYEVSVRTLGNTNYNNTEADKATVYEYSTLLTAKTIPAGSDIVQFVKDNMEDSKDEQAFELEAGANYTIDSELDFGTNQITFRGDKVNRPIVTFGTEGVIRTSAGLKIKFINFDCTNQGNKGGVVELSSNPSSSVTETSLGITPGKSSAPANCYYLEAPIIMQDCAFRNVKCCLFAVGDCSWAVSDVRVNNCIVQLDNDGSAWSNGALICGYSKNFRYEGADNAFWYGGIKDITIKNSTIYNIASNGSNRLIRFNNKDLDRVFPTAVGSATIINNTFCRTFDKKEFGNNTPNQNKYTITFNNNICYDVFRLQKFIQGNCNNVVDMTTNTIWGVANAVDATDKSKWATEEDAAFIGATDQPIDFSLPNFGINFKATGAISSTIGDPRWLE